MSYIKEFIYILCIGCMIYLGLFLWGSYHTPEQPNVVHAEFALLQHPANSQYERTENNSYYFYTLAQNNEIIKFYNEELPKHGWVLTYEGQTPDISPKGHHTTQSTHYLIYQKDNLLLRLSSGVEYSITIEKN